MDARLCCVRILSWITTNSLMRGYIPLNVPKTIHMNQSAILIAVALFVGVGGGYIIGNNTGSGGADSKEQSSARSMGPRIDRGLSSLNGSRSSSSKRYSGFEEINRIPGTSNRLQALVQFYQGLTPQQLEDEAKKLEELPMGERIMASMLLFSRWGEVDAYSAMDFAGGLGFAGMMVRPTVLQSWASVDPASAAKYYEENPREFMMMGGGRGGRGPFAGASGAGMIAGEWAKQDPDGAMAWANSLQQGKDGALASVIGEVARLDPQKAVGMLGSIDPEAASESYRAIAQSYGAKDFAATQTWISTLPADQQDVAMAAAISGLARTDPMAAAAKVSSMEEGGSKDRAVRDVVGAIAADNPAQAAEFLVQNGSQNSQEESMRDLMPAWVNKDPSGALNYAMNLEEGSVRDRALSSYVWSNSQASPAELVQVAENIGDERSRSRTVGWMASRWMREDETAAKAYIESSDAISERTREHILGNNND